MYKSDAASFSPPTLNQESFLEGLVHLSRVDADLAKVINDLGHPPMWSRKPGFPTLILIILEQQVSLASAKAAFNKLQASMDEVIPERFLEFTDEELKIIGFSRQKTTYCRGLSKALLNGTLDLGELHHMDDISARNELIKIKGIGPWTADIYLLMALLRPDIWPMGDLALTKAAQNIKRLPELPSQDKLQEMAMLWKPWRAVAARICWNYYLS